MRSRRAIATFHLQSASRRRWRSGSSCGCRSRLQAPAAVCLACIAQLVEDYRGEQQAALIEAQLASAIYLMVGVAARRRQPAGRLRVRARRGRAAAPPVFPGSGGTHPARRRSPRGRQRPAGARAARDVQALCDVAGHPLGGRRQPRDDAVDGRADGSRSHRAVAARARAGRRSARLGRGRARHRIRARRS